MTLIREDRIAETTTTTGSGVLTLGGAISTAFKTFTSVCAIGDTFYGTIEGVDGFGVPTGEWEDGLYTYSAANQITRTTVQRSSNANAAVVFSAGTKRVFLAMTRAAFATMGNYKFGGFAVGSIITNEVLMDHAVTQACTLAVNFGGAQASVGTNPAAAWTAIVQVNGTNVGTASISTLGVATFVLTSGTVLALAVGDVVTLIAPTAVDASIARLRFTFVATF